MNLSAKDVYIKMNPALRRKYFRIDSRENMQPNFKQCRKIVYTNREKKSSLKSVNRPGNTQLGQLGQLEWFASSMKENPGKKIRERKSG